MSDAIAAAAPRRGPPWHWLVALAALLAALLIPFGLVDVPPVLDYPNHLARYVVLAHPDDPVLSAIYAPRWRILPNLGMDALAVQLLKLFDVHVAGRILLALSLLAPLIGAVAYSRAAFGRFTYWSLGAGLIAYNGVFFLGFMNFLLSLGLSLIAAAAWMALRPRSALLTVAVGAMASALIFLCHIFGVALFALLIGSDELMRLVRLRRAGAPILTPLLGAAAMGALALLPALALYAASPLAGEAAAIGPWRWLDKAWIAFAPVMTPDATLTRISGVALLVMVVLVWRHAVVAPAIALALAVIGVLFVIAPARMKGGSFVDMRLAVMFALLLVAGLAPQVSRRAGLALGAAFALLIAGRSVVVAMIWVDHRHDLAELRAAIAHVAPGERVMVARQSLDAAPKRAGRSLPGQWLDSHVAALLLIERRAFWPYLFAEPSQQPLEVRPAYRALVAPPLSEPPEWAGLTADNATLSARGDAFLVDWRDRFDALLLLDPPHQPPQGFAPSYRGDYVALYRREPAQDRNAVRP